ncbi:MAG: hypothetical protein KAS52_07625, partial [Candidatus Heimdallarchaeota archaeon]|nr:hypothetical protein [Candidatus Heimdallarchaeota archaeon]
VVVQEPEPVAVPLVSQVPSVPITEEITSTETESLPEIVDEPIVIEETDIVEPEIILPPAPAPVKLVAEELKEETEQAEPAPQVPAPPVPESTTVPDVQDIKVTETPPEQQIVPEFVEKMVIESIPEQSELIETVVENKIEDAPDATDPAAATLNGIGDSSAISFTADDITNFANFLVQKKETILEDISPDAIKDMSDFLTKGSKAKSDETIEEKEEQTVE